MSALGHKRTFRSAIVMSALPAKADILQRKTEADSTTTLHDLQGSTLNLAATIPSDLDVRLLNRF
jgi:hypothetical protein